MSSRTIAVVALAGWLCCSAIAPAQQLPTFRTGVDLVTVDVTVLDGAGRPIERLGPEHFVLKVDGRPRPIVSVQFVPHARPVPVPPEAVPRHYTSNEHADRGRLILVAVDQANIRRVEGTAALRAAARFIDALDPFDRVGVTSLASVAPVEFTRDHHAARERLQRLVGEADPVFIRFNIGLVEAVAVSDGSRAKLDEVVTRECGERLSRLENPQRIAEANGMRDPCPVQVEQEARAIAQYARSVTRTSIDALHRLIERLKSIEGPKTLVLLSEGLVAEPQLVDFTELGASAQAARVTIYVLQLEVPVFDAAQERVSPSAFQDRQLHADGLVRLAGAARGALFPLVGSDPYPFQRIARELSGYYLLAFEPQPGDRDGRLHRIQVSLNRAGATMRARPAFRLEPAVTSVASTEDRLVDLLHSPRLSTELPLRTATYTYQEPGTAKLRVVVSVEAEPADGLAADVTLGFVLLDDGHVIAASGMHPAEAGRYAFSAVVAPGRYTLKVAAIDGLGRLGSVERTFAAELVARAGIGVSDLILAAVPLRADAPLQPIVDRAPDDRLLAYLELYASDDQPLSDPRVHLELAPSESGPAILTIPAAIVRRDDRWCIARAVVPLTDLRPGAYMARAEVSVGGRPATRVTRSFNVMRNELPRTQR